MNASPLPHAHAVILAGGRGERFWPLSRFARPKQFITLFGGRSLLRQAADRLEGVVPKENIWIITSRDLLDATREDLPEIPSENLVGEPFGRDTAAACALATELVASRDSDRNATLAILTADQLMCDIPVFRQTLRDSFELAASSPKIVTIGITPDKPATGFGYIEASEPLDRDTPTSFHAVSRFVEKPNAETAAAYVAGGRHYWNAGMFVWSVPTFRDSLREHRPSLADAMKRLSPDIGTDAFEAALARTYETLERISVDYAIMEHAQNIVMARGMFGWDDVGSWEAAAQHFAADAAGNVRIGTIEAVDSRGNLVLGQPNHLVALFGVEDLVVVQTADATLICPQNRAQDLKTLVRRLADRPDGTSWL